MKNRHSTKRETKMGTFTTVSYSLLRDKTLTVTAKLLMIEILSDSDDMTLSPSLYSKRMGVTIKSIYNAIDCLIENGYIRRKDISKPNSEGIHTRPVYHYTISEYGNLKSKDDVTPTPIIEEKPVVISTDKPTKDQINKFFDWIDALPVDKKTYLDSIWDVSIVKKYSEMKRIGKLVTDYKEVAFDINNFLDTLELLGTIDDKKGFKLRMINETNQMTDNEKKAYINNKKVHYNQKINVKKTANLNQEYQQ